MTKSERPMLWTLLATLLFAATVYPQDQSRILSAQVDDFATVLITTNSPQERDSLLVSKKDLVTPDLRKSIIRQGNAHMMAGQYARAFDIYNIAHNVASRIDDKEGLAAASLNLGTVYYFQGDFAQALEHYKTSRRLSLETQNKYEAAKALSGIALIQKEQQANDEALSNYELALKEFTALGDHDEMAKSLSSIGAIHYAKGDYPAATQALLRSAELNPDSENKLRTADAFYMQGDYEKASNYYDEALKEFESSRNSAGLIGSLTGAANTAYYLGNYDDALNLLRRNITVQDRFGDESGVATSLQSMGNVYRAQGDYSSALDSYLRSIERADRSQVKISTATTYGSIGLVRSLQGANLDAIAYFRKSLSEFEQTGDKVGRSRMLSHIGNAQYANADYKSALESYTNALALREAMNDQTNKAYLLVGIGTVHLSTKEYQAALDSYAKALTIFESTANREAAADTLTRLADVYLRRDEYAQSLSHANRAATLARQIESLDILWFARLVSGKAQLKLDQPALALQSFSDAVSIVEASRARPHSGETGPARSSTLPYLALVDLLMSQNKPAEAFLYLEQAKVQSLTSLLKRGRALSIQGLSPNERDRERNLLREISSLEMQIAREAESRNSTPARRTTLAERRRLTLTNYEQFRKALHAAHPALKINRGELAPAKTDDLQKVVTDRDTAFLEYIVTENRIYLFVATTNEPTKVGARKSGPTAITLKAYPLQVQNADLIERVIGFTRSLAFREQSFSQPARQLFDELLKPAAEQLAGKSKLVIVPDGFLWRVPFEALQPEEDRYLIDRAAITYAPSLAALREMNKPRSRSVRGANGLVAFASPLLSDDQKRRNELTRQTDASTRQQKEIEELTTVYGKPQTRLLTATDVSKERVRNEITRAGILHFASPAFLDDTSPLYSLIELSSVASNPTDGMFFSREVVNLQTTARTVVISNAALRNDHIANGEALTGLTWAWFVAGSPTTLVGRWTVEHTSKSKLMFDLHSRLKPSPLNRTSKAAAHHDAALSLRNSTDFQHPYYWASFALIGDGR